MRERMEEVLFRLFGVPNEVVRPWHSLDASSLEQNFRHIPFPVSFLVYNNRATSPWLQLATPKTQERGGWKSYTCFAAAANWGSIECAKRRIQFERSRTQTSPRNCLPAVVPVLRCHCVFGGLVTTAEVMLATALFSSTEGGYPKACLQPVRGKVSTISCS